MVEKTVHSHFWETDIVLKDGTTAHLRTICVEDTAKLQKFHTKQSPTSIYMRFFTYKSKLSNKELKHFTKIDYENRVVLIVTVAAEIVGFAVYNRIKNTTKADIAFQIADQHQRRGISTVLLEHLVYIAKNNQIEQFVADMLPNNKKMFSVFENFGYSLQTFVKEETIQVTFNLCDDHKAKELNLLRENYAEAKSVFSMLFPKTIAVIGASRGYGNIGHQLLHNLIGSGFSNPVYAVNPEAFELGGVISYATIQEIPVSIDLAIIAIPATEISKILLDCAAAGVKTLIVVSDGFAENGKSGLKRQRELVKLARYYGMRILGPASLGIINTTSNMKLSASLAPALPKKGCIALFTQSAAVGVHLFSIAFRRNIGISNFINTGNRCDISGNEILQYLDTDENTKFVGMFLESIGNPRKFFRIAAKVSNKKPIVVAKSEIIGKILPPGHDLTKTVASPKILDAILRQAGVIVVESVEQILDVGQFISQQPLPAGKKIAVVTNAQALGQIVSEAAINQGLSLTHPAITLKLRQGLSDLKNKTLTLNKDTEVDIILFSFLPHIGIETQEIVDALLQTDLQKPAAVCFLGILDSTLPNDQLFYDTGLKNSLPGYPNPFDMAKAVSATVDYSIWRKSKAAYKVATELTFDVLGAKKFVNSLLTNMSDSKNRKSITLSAEQVSHLLKFYDIHVSSVKPKIEMVENYSRIQHFCTITSFKDPLYGSIISFGMLGDSTTFLNDLAYAMPPLNSFDIMRLLEYPKAAKKLFGYDDFLAADTKKLASLVKKLSSLVSDLPEIVFCQLHPVAVSKQSLDIINCEIRLARIDFGAQSLPQSLKSF